LGLALGQKHMNHIQMVEHFEDFWFRIVGRASCNQTYTDLCKKKERKKERKKGKKKEREQPL
jgi:hypothetical protein